MSSLPTFTGTTTLPVVRAGTVAVIQHVLSAEKPDMAILTGDVVTLPSLAFLHIPILEFKNIENKETTIGTNMEGVASSEINSGLFSSFLEKQDVMGVFVGHDHDNDYIGIEHDIVLAFGRTTGIDAYGVLERGARIIRLYEDKFRFDTWIRTRKERELDYYFPSGLSSVDEESMTYLPAKKISEGVAKNISL